jgi:hypothetical protein
MTDAFATLREMLANVPDDAQVYVREMEEVVVEWPGITAGTFRALLDEVAGFEAMWEQREKAHDAALVDAQNAINAYRKSRNAYRRDWQQAKAQLATAEREVHDAISSALNEMADGFFSQIEMQGAACLATRIRNRLDAATPKGDDCGWCERNGGHGACECATPSGELCDADCGCPSPEAREVDSEFLLRVVQEVNAYAVITPADAKRIVAMAQEAE